MFCNSIQCNIFTRLSNEKKWRKIIVNLKGESWNNQSSIIIITNLIHWMTLPQDILFNNVVCRFATKQTKRQQKQLSMIIMLIKTPPVVSCSHIVGNPLIVTHQDNILYFKKINITSNDLIRPHSNTPVGIFDGIHSRL